MQFKWHFILMLAALLIVSSTSGQPDTGSNIQLGVIMINSISEQGSEAPPGGGTWGISGSSETFESLGQGTEAPAGGSSWGISGSSETFESPRQGTEALVGGGSLGQMGRMVNSELMISEQGSEAPAGGGSWDMTGSGAADHIGWISREPVGGGSWGMTPPPTGSGSWSQSSPVSFGQPPTSTIPPVGTGDQTQGGMSRRLHV